MRKMRILLALILVALPACAQSEVTQEQLAAFEGKLADLTDNVLKATVGLQAGMSGGSGVIVTEDGYVLTAAHVFQRAGQRLRITLSDGRRVSAKGLGRMTSDDYGLVKIDGDGPWPFAPMGSSKQLEKDQLCIAVGHPGGVQIGRTAPLRLGTILRTSGKFLRTNAIVDRGDSGGPLFDLDGRVIGIHSRIGSNTNMNMHVPVDRYRRDWKRLAASESWTEYADVDWPTNGVMGIRGSYGPRGSRIMRVYPGMPAEKAKLRRGDVITGIDGTEVGGWDDIEVIMKDKKPGDEIELTIRRDSSEIKKKLTLAAPPQPKGEREQPAIGEMPTVKDDPVASFVGAGKKLKDAFAPLVDDVKKGVVTIESEGNKEVLGTVLSKDGWIVTKASELGDNPTFKSDDDTVALTVVKSFDEYDLAFLKADTKGLTPVNLVDEKHWKWGQWLVSAGPRKTIGVGVVSVLPRPLAYRGFLGVTFKEREGTDTVVGTVAEGSAAEKAKLAPDDIIVGVGGVAVKERLDLIARIGGKAPGTVLDFTIQRGDTKFQIKAVLGVHPDDLAALDRQRRADERRNRDNGSSRRRGRRGRRSLAGTRVSNRKSGFATVVQHDTVMHAEQCGSPVLDLSGKCVGINIARVARYCTYAIPAPIVVKLLAEAKAQ